MHGNTDLQDIHELNMSYLILAQRLLRSNYATGMYRLGLDAEAARVLCDFSLAQLVKLASSNVMLCKFRLNDYELLSALNRDGLGGTLLMPHTTLLLSDLDAEQARDSTR